MFNLDGSGITLIAIAASVVAAIVVVWAIASRYKVSDPDEAFVVSGSKSKTQVPVRLADGTTTLETRPVPSKVVLGGGGVFVVPFLGQNRRMSFRSDEPLSAGDDVVVDAVLASNQIKVSRHSA